MREKVGWLGKIKKLKIRDRYRLSHFRAPACQRLSVAMAGRKVRKRLVGALSLLLVLAMVLGLSVVRGPLPTAGLPAEALA